MTIKKVLPGLVLGLIFVVVFTLGVFGQGNNNTTTKAAPEPGIVVPIITAGATESTTAPAITATSTNQPAVNAQPAVTPAQTVVPTTKSHEEKEHDGDKTEEKDDD